MDLLLRGLTLSLTGLAITFAALGLLILIIVVLNRLFAPPTHAPADLRRQELEPATIAAIAAALRQTTPARQQRTGLGDTLTKGAGRWWRPGSSMVSPPGRPGPTSGDS